MLTLLVLASLVLTGCPQRGEPTAQPTFTLTPTPVAPDETPEPTPEPTPSPEDPEEEEEEEPRDPTDADRARFIAEYRPGGATGMQHVAADLDGDGIREIVFASVLASEDRTRVDVAAWTGTTYEIVDREPGGPAERIDSFRISDVNLDGRTDVVVVQSIGSSGQSASVWSGAPGGMLDPLRAVGDCFDGSHTYGDTGVNVTDRTGDGRAEIAATCEDADLPQPLWPTVVYVWRDGAYRCDHRETSDGVTTECQS